MYMEIYMYAWKGRKKEIRLKIKLLELSFFTVFSRAM
jgi:hypothetical protein